MGKTLAKTEQVIELAFCAGSLLLENGAEISRVEETMERICVYYGVRSENAFVLSNGIFITGNDEEGNDFVRVQHIPVSGTHLNKVIAINQLSREIEGGKYSVEEAMGALEAIRSEKEKGRAVRIGAAGLGSAAFCYLFGGSVWDSAVVFVAGMLLYSFQLYFAVPHLSKITGNIAGSLVAVLFCGCLYLAGAGQDLSYMAVGAVMPLVPGVAFVNAIRDIADGDYISGFVRMLDALLVFFCIAAGVGGGFFIIGQLRGWGF